jgi:Arm DNA-binding domain
MSTTIKAIKLTDGKVRILQAAPGQRDDYRDAGCQGLRLRVSGPTPRHPHGTKVWNFFGRVGGSAPLRDTLGDYPAMSLAAARVRVNEIIAARVDPRLAKQQAKKEALAEARKAANTVKAVAEDWIVDHLVLTISLGRQGTTA